MWHSDLQTSKRCYDNFNGKVLEQNLIFFQFFEFLFNSNMQYDIGYKWIITGVYLS